MTTAKLLQNCFYAMVSTVYTAFKSDQKTLNTYIDCVSLEKVIRKRFDIRGQQQVFVFLFVPKSIILFALI